jgi:hypothetical protein
MALCHGGLHDHIQVICAKHYLFGQAKPGFPKFADVNNLDCQWARFESNEITNYYLPLAL